MLMRTRAFLFKIFLLAILAFTGQAFAATSETDSTAAPPSELQVSLLTCEPGQEVYEVYGHAGLRIYRPGHSDTDYVLNYGVFDFNTEHFVLRWMLGKTDYTVEALPYRDFVEWYKVRGRNVHEQPLNLRPDEIERLAAAALGDAQAAQRDGWTYRYNFFYNNCVTRPIDLILNSLDEGSRVEWPEPEPQSLRQMLHQFAAPVSTWNADLQDWLLGQEVDGNAPLRSQLFAPIWASRYMAQASVVRSDGSRTPLVGAPAIPYSLTMPDKAHDPVVWTTAALLALLLLLAVAELSGRVKHLWAGIVAVHTVQGLVGLLIGTLFFFSTHPSVDSNWLLAACNPLWLVAAWYVGRFHADHRRMEGHRLLCLLTFLILIIGQICGQRFPWTAIPLEAFLCVCAIAPHRYATQN